MHSMQSFHFQKIRSKTNAEIFNLARQLVRSEFNSEIKLIRLANLQQAAFLISVSSVSASFTDKEAGGMRARSKSEKLLWKTAEEEAAIAIAMLAIAAVFNRNWTTFSH